MKKGLRYGVLILLTLSLLLCLCACGDGEEGESEGEGTLYTVSFDSQGGTEVPAQQVVSGGTVIEPAIPVREGYIFDCWRNAETGIMWGFLGGVVESDLTLRADWIAADQIFEIEQIGDGDTARLTGLKNRDKREYRLPTVVKGFTVVSVGEGAFARLESDHVGRIVLPDTVHTVEARAFEGSSGILIEVEGALTEVGEGAFKNCDGLQKITLAEGMTRLSAEAFWGCASLTELRLPSTVTEIGENALQDCVSLRELLLGKGVTAVEDGAFMGCTGLAVIYFEGEEGALEELLDSAAPHNDPFVTCKKCYLYAKEAPTEPTVFEGYWYLDENNRFRVWKAE